MAIAQPLRGRLVDRAAQFALQLRGEQAAAHPDLAMNAPDRQFETFLAKGEVPGADMVVDAVDERAVEIEQEATGEAMGVS